MTGVGRRRYNHGDGRGQFRGRPGKKGRIMATMDDQTVAAPGDPRHLSPSDVAAYGIDTIAYVKPVEIDGEAAFAVYAADGRLLASLEDRDTALAVVRHNDLEPLSVH
jgi:hypothetical protein